MNEYDLLKQSSPLAAGMAAGMVLGRAQSNPHQGGRAFVLLPDHPGGMKVVYLERPDLPHRRSGTVKVTDVESFINTAARWRSKEGSQIYASLNPVQLLAVLNDNEKVEVDGKTGWRDHRVLFQLQHSKEYAAWAESNGKTNTFNQHEFAEFIEDNLPDFKNPAGARMLDMALNFRAKSQVSYKGGMRLSNGSLELQYTEQVEGGAGAQGKVQIPEIFTIYIPVWAGLEQKKYEFEARLRYRIGAGALSIWYELNRPHKVVEQAFADTIAHVEKSLEDTPIVFGTPE